MPPKLRSSGPGHRSYVTPTKAGVAEDLGNRNLQGHLLGEYDAMRMSLDSVIEINEVFIHNCIHMNGINDSKLMFASLGKAQIFFPYRPSLEAESWAENV